MMSSALWKMGTDQKGVFKMSTLCGVIDGAKAKCAFSQFRQSFIHVGAGLHKAPDIPHECGWFWPSSASVIDSFFGPLAHSGIKSLKTFQSCKRNNTHSEDAKRKKKPVQERLVFLDRSWTPGHPPQSDNL